MRKTAEEIIRTYDVLKSERSQLDADWEMLGRLVAPGRGKVYEIEADYEESTRRTFPEKYDSTAVIASQALASALHSGLTSPSSQWFHLRFENSKLNEDVQAKKWLEDCSAEIYFALQESNFNLEVNELYLDDVVFGTTVMFHEDLEGEFRFSTTHAREVYFTEDFHGNANGIYRPRQYTAEQIYQKFPKNCPEDIKEKALNAAGKTDKQTVIQCALLKDDRFPEKNLLAGPQEDLPFEVRYILQNGAIDLTEDDVGYYELPAYVVRWGRMAGSKFGFSPALNVLPDIKSLNSLVEVILASAAKVVDPPILTLKRGVLSDPDLTPGGETVVSTMDAMRPFESGARFDVSQLERSQLVETVRRAFYVDQLDLPQNDRMTATEVQIRYEQMQARLGPQLFRIQTDFLSPLIRRSFAMLYRAGKFPQPPQVVLDNADQLSVDYLGPLARNQKMQGVTAIERVLIPLSSIASFQPEVLDGFKWGEIGRDIAMRVGVPADLLNSKREIKRIQDQRKEAQNAAMQAELSATVAGALKDSGSAAKDMSEAGVVM